MPKGSGNEGPGGVCDFGLDRTVTVKHLRSSSLPTFFVSCLVLNQRTLAHHSTFPCSTSTQRPESLSHLSISARWTLCEWSCHRIYKRRKPSSPSVQEGITTTCTEPRLVARGRGLLTFLQKLLVLGDARSRRTGCGS